MYNEKIKIYLDDVRTPNDSEWIVARDYEQFVEQVNKYGLENIDLISLDHDLGDDAMVEYYNNAKENFTIDYNNIREKTGYDACKFLVNKSMEKNIPLPTVFVHSANPIGCGNMIGYINNYLKNCKMETTCKWSPVPHHIGENFMLSPEARSAKWKRRGD
jgi:hypothetical protein